MMIIAVLAYSLTTGLSAFSFNWLSFAILRFLVGVAVGSEWATGSSMVAELWPDRARGKGAGLMQCGLGIGFFIASLVWLFVSPLGPGSWRYMYMIGVVPALLTLWIRRSIPESRCGKRPTPAPAVRSRQRSGETLRAPEQALARFTLFDLFADRTVRRQTIIVFLMSLASTVGFWGISTWVPPFVGGIAAAAGLAPRNGPAMPAWPTPSARWSDTSSLGFLADAYGRKPVTIVVLRLRAAAHAGPVLLDARPEHAAAAGLRERVLQQWPVHLDAGVAARALSDANARHGARLRVQRTALHRVSRSLAGRDHDRAVWRVRSGGDGVGPHLSRGNRRDAVSPGNSRQTAASVMPYYDASIN